MALFKIYTASVATVFGGLAFKMYNDHSKAKKIAEREILWYESNIFNPMKKEIETENTTLEGLMGYDKKYSEWFRKVPIESFHMVRHKVDDQYWNESTTYYQKINMKNRSQAL